MQETENVRRSLNRASRRLLRLVSHGELPSTEAVDAMAAEFSGDACEAYALNQAEWGDHIWEMVRTAGRRRLRDMTGT